MNYESKSKSIFNMLPEKVKENLLQQLAVYYHNRYLFNLMYSSLVYKHMAENKQAVITGYIDCLQHIGIIDSTENGILAIFFFSELPHKELTQNNSDITIYNNLSKYMEV